MLLRPRQKDMVERIVGALSAHDNTLAVAPTGCHAAGTPILYFDGRIKPVEEIQKGDMLMGPDSTPRRVLALHRGHDRMVEVRPIKGEPFLVNHGHILALVKTAEYAGEAPHYTTIAVSDYPHTTANFRHLHKLYRVPVDFTPQEALPLDAYFLGVLLGDGGLKYGVPSVTTADPEIAAFCQEMADKLMLSLRIEQIPGNEANTYHFTGRNGGENHLTRLLRDLGVYGHGAESKYIPHGYKIASRADRAAILAGLLDTDGCAHHGCIEFSSASRRLAEDVAFIARSLGFMALPKPKEVNGKTYWRFNICGDFSTIPLRVARRILPKRQQKKDPLRTGFSLHEAGYGEYFGFTVDGDHLYVMGDFTVTHNSGKTVMLSAALGKLFEQHSIGKACVLQHRDELTGQNSRTFRRFNPDLSASVFNAEEKSWHGDVGFAMVQTLARESNLATLPKLDALVIDEAHHARADSYMRVIEQARHNNPGCKLLGVTATPLRGDKKGLRAVFDNVCDQITVGELIRSGHLVPPRTFVMDVGVQDELRHVKQTVSDYDMGEVAEIMDRRPINQAVVQHWKEKAGDRQTVIFCSTVAHAAHVSASFLHAGIATALVHGGLGDEERRQLLAEYAAGKYQIIVNVAVLTEGWDHPPTSCVVLLRPSSHKSTMIQMIGRGLRIVDPKEWPNITKSDCVVLDFGTSTLMHGSLEQAVELDDPEKKKGGASGTGMKECPGCKAEVPARLLECSLCGYAWPVDDTIVLPIADFAMREIEILRNSPFLWCDPLHNDQSMVAGGFKAWGTVLKSPTGQWQAVGGVNENRSAQLLASGDKAICLAAANDWLNLHETESSAHKTKRWLYEQATDKQLRYLPKQYRHDYALTRYEASALLTLKFNNQAIKQAVASPAAPEHVGGIA